jgi:hypothetical protein
MMQLLGGESFAVFEAWKKKPDRIEY